MVKVALVLASRYIYVHYVRTKFTYIFIFKATEPSDKSKILTLQYRYTITHNLVGIFKIGSIRGMIFNPQR
jgi:hypothetical protein